MSRPKRQIKPTQKPDFTYSHPAGDRNSRRKQRKEIHAKLKANPKSLHFDCLFQSPQTASNKSISDILFFTDRVQVWKDICQAFYSTHTPVWRTIDHGMQLTVSGNISIVMNFYDNGTVMVQSKNKNENKKMWADEHFPKLKDSVNALVTAADQV